MQLTLSQDTESVAAMLHNKRVLHESDGAKQAIVQEVLIE